MAKQRYINTKFWDDPYIVNLDPIQKLLFLYFLTNSLTTICGIYEVSLKKIAFDTGIDGDMILKIVGKFQDDKKILYITGWIIIANFIKHQNVNSPQIQKAIEAELKKVPENIIKYGMDTISNYHYIKLNINNNKEPENGLYHNNPYFSVSPEKHAEYKKLFPKLNIDHEYLLMKDWLDSNPSRRKKDYGRFITNWLRNAKPSVGEVDYDVFQ